MYIPTVYDHRYNTDAWHSGDILKHSNYASSIMSLIYLLSFAYKLKNA